MPTLRGRAALRVFHVARLELIASQGKLAARISG
jgi:hypothetical protein